MPKIRQTSINAAVFVFFCASLALLLFGNRAIGLAMEELKAAAEEEQRTYVLRSSMIDALNDSTDQARDFIVTKRRASLEAFCATATQASALDAEVSAIAAKGPGDDAKQAFEWLKKAREEMAASELRSVKLAAKAIGMAGGELPPLVASLALSSPDEALGEAGKLQLAQKLIFGAEHWELKRRTLKAVDALLDLVQERAARKAEAARNSAGRALGAVTAICLLFFLIGLGVMLLFYKLTALPIRHYVRALSASKPGAAVSELEPEGSAELVELARIINLRRIQRLRAEKAFKDTELRLKANLFMMPLGAIEIDIDGKVLSWNPAAERIFGFTEEEAIGRDMLSLIVPERLQGEVGDIIDQLRRGAVIDKHVNANLRKGGREIICEWYNTPLMDSTGERIGWASIVKDITAERAEAEKLLYLSRHDPLTGLLNRRSMQERLDEEARRCKRTRGSFAVIMLDIDKFKRFNDKHGHECGDEVLKAVARVMTSTVRETDSVGRWGGEEFLILLPETELHGGVELAEKVREKIEGSVFSYGDEELRLTVTAGVASILERDRSADDCIRRADEALYLGKERGRNRVEAS